MNSKIKVLIAALCLTCAPAFASLSFVTTPGALGSNDSTSWSGLGGDETALGSTFGATSTGSISVTGAFTATPTAEGLVAVVCPETPCTWGPVSGGMVAGDTDIWAYNNSKDVGTGPITLTLGTAILGAGLWIDGDTAGVFTAQIQVYNGVTLLGTSPGGTSDSAGDPVFIGALDSSAVITKVVISLTSCAGCNGSGDTADFAIDKLLMTDSVVSSPTPEPSSLLLFGSGLAGIAWMVRKRSWKNGRRS
jgi:hypothetical protein